MVNLKRLSPSFSFGDDSLLIVMISARELSKVIAKAGGQSPNADQAMQDSLDAASMINSLNDLQLGWLPVNSIPYVSPLRFAYWIIS